MTQKSKCPHCGAEIQSGNFCSACGGKLVKVCDCSFLGKPFDCGYDKCPGFEIYRLVSPARTQKERNHDRKNSTDNRN